MMFSICDMFAYNYRLEKMFGAVMFAFYNQYAGQMLTQGLIF